MRDLQLASSQSVDRPSIPGSSEAQQLWRRSRRRLSDIKGIIERRRFKQVRSQFYDRLWREAAAEVGADLSILPNGLRKISQGGLTTIVDQSELMLDSAILDRLLLNKGVVYDWLAAKGLPVVKSARFTLESLAIAEDFLSSHEGPVVVKPMDGTGAGHGVTTGITDVSGLRAAATRAAALHPGLLIETQLDGASFRLLYLDGQFLDAVRRDPPVLVGDGKSSIRRLAQAENERRRACSPITALSPLLLDLESRNTLASHARDFATVPASGEEVMVKLASNENGAAQNHIVRDEVHPDVIEAGSRAVRDLNIGFAGLDLMSSDISAPLTEGKTAFCEINANPGIHHHYLVSNAALSANVASRILEHIFSSRHGAITL